MQDAKGGVVKIDVGSGGDSAHDGAQVGSAEMFKCDKDLYYETRVKFTNPGFAFIGLSAGADDGVILDGTSDLNNADMLGFYLDGTTATNASMDFYSRKDSVNSTVSGVATVGTDFIRLGFSVKAGIVTVWVDGEKMGTVESNIPSDEELGIVWAITSDGTDGVHFGNRLRSRIYGSLNGLANPVGCWQHRCRGWRGGLGLCATFGKYGNID